MHDEFYYLRQQKSRRFSFCSYNVVSSQKIYKFYYLYEEKLSILLDTVIDAHIYGGEVLKRRGKNDA